MAAQLKVKRGSSGNLSSLPVVDGQLLFTTDTKKIYLDNGATRLQVGGGTISTGSANGTIAVDGVDVAVKGLGARAFDSTSYLPLAGGTMTGNITAPAFIGSLQGYATRAERSYLTYNDSKVYYYNFGGATDLNWKKVASIYYGSNESYVGATIKGIVYYFTGNYNQAEVQEYNFQVNNTFTGGSNLIVDQCQFRKSPGCPDIIRVVKIDTNNYELQVRQLEDWEKIAIQFTISSTNLITPCEPVDSSNNSAISVSDLNESHSLYSEYAYKIKDSGDGRNLTFNYSADGLSSVTWLAGWNGAELRAVSPSVVTAGAATKLATARNFSIGNAYCSFDGSADVNLDTTNIFSSYSARALNISWDDLYTGFTTMYGSNDYNWSGTNCPPGEFYKWGGTFTLKSPSNNGSFAQLYFAHTASDGHGILYRSGWGVDRKSWATILDSNNYTSYCAPASHTHNYLPLSGGTLSGPVYTTSAFTTSAGKVSQFASAPLGGLFSNGVAFTNPTTRNDVGWIRILGTGESDTVLEIATGDDGGESTAENIAVRQYNTSNTIAREAYLLNAAGNTTFPGSVTAASVYGAVWNDYAEFRSQNETIEPGYITYCDDDGKLKKTTERLQKYEGIVSDTFGFAIGETDDCKTPLAVSGRALVYCDPEEEHFHSGDCVCAGPDGLAYRMTREEIMEFPDRIVGVVSEIPTYETWGTGNVAVNGRIWIKVR